MSNECFRVGIIGTGRIASSIQDEVATAPYSFLFPYSHAGAYVANPETVIVSASDTNAERLKVFGERWGVTALYDDHRAMLANEQLDLVSVCTPTRSHAAIVEDIAGSSVRGIFLEKPIAESLRQADAMIAAVDSAGIATVVNHVRTYDPYYQRIRWIIEEGQIGELHGVLVRWREGMSFGGSHLFDLLRYLLGSEAEWVFGHLDGGDGLFDPGGSGVVGFANGVEVFVDNRVGHAGPRELDIAGSAGRIRVGDTLYPELFTIDPASPFGELVLRGFPGSLQADSGMKAAVAELVRAVQTGSRPRSTIDDGRRNLEIAVAFALSDRSRCRVDLPVTDLDLLVQDPWGRG